MSAGWLLGMRLALEAREMRRLGGRSVAMIGSVDAALQKHDVKIRRSLCRTRHIVARVNNVCHIAAVFVWHRILIL